MKKRTITDCIKEEMEKGDGRPREIHARLCANKKLKKQLGDIRLQTVTTALHKGDVKRNPRGWCKSGGRPLHYSLTAAAGVANKAGKGLSDALSLEPLMVAILPAIAGGILTGLNVLATRSRNAAGTTDLAAVLATTMKNCVFPTASAANLSHRQKRAA